MTYTLCIVLIYYAIAYCLLSLMSAMLENVSQNVSCEVLVAQEGKMVSVRRSSVTTQVWPMLG